MKSIPEDRREADENDYRKNEIVQKLTDEGRYVRLHSVCKLAVGIFSECLTDSPIQHIVNNCGGQKRDGTSKEDKPRTAENRVERAVIVGGRRNDTRDEKDKAGQKIYHSCQNRYFIRRLRTEMLGDNVHTHKRQPRDQNTAVKCDPIKLQKRFICKQIHTNNAHDKESHDRCGHAPQ